MNVNQLIDQYLESRKLAWSESTKRSERYRLEGLAAHIDGNAHTLWNELERRNIKPYTRLTIFTRVATFWRWALNKGFVEGKNDYERFKDENARQFKNVYQPKKPALTFEEAKERIQGIRNRDIQQYALGLLESGLRVSEPERITADGVVLGKGNKPRMAYTDYFEAGRTRLDYYRLRKALGEIGLKPHDLRKLFLTEVVKAGANEFELKEIAGWASIQTASSYIKTNTDRMRQLVNKARQGKVITDEQVFERIPTDPGKGKGTL